MTPLRLILCASAAALLLSLPFAGGAAQAYSQPERPAAAASGGAAKPTATQKRRATKPTKATKKPAKRTKRGKK